MHPCSPESLADIRRYCKGCGYDLRACLENRCSECGRKFDPKDPKTFAQRPPKKRSWLKRGLAALLTVLVLMGGAYGWLFWGWWEEKQALDKLIGVGFSKPRTFGPGWGGAGWGVKCIQSTAFTIGPKWLGKYLGPGAFVLDRVICLSGYGSKVTDGELASLQAIKWLEYLELDETSVSDLSVLSKLTGLQGLRIKDTKVSDLSPLANLTALQELRFADTKVSDLSPVVKLTGLKKLDCCGTKVTDLSPLTNLTGLRELYFTNTKVSDLTPLFRLKALGYLYVPKETVTEAQVQELRRALPKCKIERE